MALVGRPYTCCIGSRLGRQLRQYSFQFLLNEFGTPARAAVCQAIPTTGKVSITGTFPVEVQHEEIEQGPHRFLLGQRRCFKRTSGELEKEVECGGCRRYTPNPHCH